MNDFLKHAGRVCLELLVRLAGSDLRDHQTGRVIGRALLFCWGGRVHLIGLASPVVPRFLPQQRLTYWHVELGFTAPPEVDFPGRSAPGPATANANGA